MHNFQSWICFWQVFSIYISSFVPPRSALPAADMRICKAAAGAI